MVQEKGQEKKPQEQKEADGTPIRLPRPSRLHAPLDVPALVPTVGIVIPRLVIERSRPPTWTEETHDNRVSDEKIHVGTLTPRSEASFLCQTAPATSSRDIFFLQKRPATWSR